jgi:hypothetical protein
VCVHLVVAEIVRYAFKEVWCVKPGHTWGTTNLAVNVTNWVSVFACYSCYCSVSLCDVLGTVTCVIMKPRNRIFMLFMGFGLM